MSVSTGDRNVSSHSDGNDRVLLAIQFFALVPLRAKRSFSITERLTHFRSTLHNTAMLPLAKFTNKIYTVHRKSYIKASVTFTQHPSCR